MEKASARRHNTCIPFPPTSLPLQYPPGLISKIFYRTHDSLCTIAPHIMHKDCPPGTGKDQTATHHKRSRLPVPRPKTAGTSHLLTPQHRTNISTMRDTIQKNMRLAEGVNIQPPAAKPTPVQPFSRQQTQRPEPDSPQSFPTLVLHPNRHSTGTVALLHDDLHTV